MSDALKVGDIAIGIRSGAVYEITGRIPDEGGSLRYQGTCIKPGITTSSTWVGSKHTTLMPERLELYDLEEDDLS